MAKQFINQALATVTVAGQQVNLSSNTVTAALLDNTVVTLVKTQSNNLVAVGSTITYTIVITNLSIEELKNFNFQDILPVGLTYQVDSFKVDNVVKVPVVADQSLSYNFDKLPIGATTVNFVCKVA